jgi:hypothetical protein
MKNKQHNIDIENEVHVGKKSVAFFSSYESIEEVIKKTKPSKIAELHFIKKIRSMRRKLKYLTEAEDSEE